MTARPPLSERLLARLTAMGLEMPEGTRLVRTNASRSARANGAWVWRAEDPTGWFALPVWYRDRQGGVGSIWPMLTLLQNPRLTLVCPHSGDISVWPSPFGEVPDPHEVREGCEPGAGTVAWWRPRVPWVTTGILDKGAARP
jgi:hypothetical protein